MTATEIRLQMAEGTPTLQRLQAAFERAFVEPLTTRLALWITVRQRWVTYNPNLLLTHQKDHQ